MTTGIWVQRKIWQMRTDLCRLRLSLLFLLNYYYYFLSSINVNWAIWPKRQQMWSFHSLIFIIEYHSFGDHTLNGSMEHIFPRWVNVCDFSSYMQTLGWIVCIVCYFYILRSENVIAKRVTLLLAHKIYFFFCSLRF